MEIKDWGLVNPQSLTSKVNDGQTLKVTSITLE